MNAAVSGCIYRLAATEDEGNVTRDDMSVGSIVGNHVCVGSYRVQGALKHSVREWSEEGRRERHQMFGWSSMH